MCSIPSRTPRPASRTYRKSYNPLAVLKPDSPTIIEDAGLIADALVVRSGRRKDPHWDESAKNFIEGVILHVATDPRYEGRRNLLTVRDLIRTALTQESRRARRRRRRGRRRAALRHQRGDAAKRGAVQRRSIDRRPRRARSKARRGISTKNGPRARGRAFDRAPPHQVSRLHGHAAACWPGMISIWRT